MYITEDTGDIYVFTSETERLHLNADKATYLRNADGTANYDYATISKLLDDVANLTEDFGSFENTYKAIKLSVSGGDFTVSGLLNEYNTIVATNGTLKTVNADPGSYGLSADSEPAHGESFSVPYITVDGKGRVTAASTKTVTLPSIDEIDSSLNSLQEAIDALEDEAADIRVDFAAADATTLASAKSDTDTKLTALKNGSTKTIKDLEDSISTLSETVSSNYNTLDAAYKAADDQITKNYKAADSALETAYKAADSAIRDTITNLKDGSEKTIADLAADTTTLSGTVNSNYNTLNAKIDQEITDRTNAVSNEASARSTGDTNTLTSAKKYTDDELAAIVADSESTLESIDIAIADLQSADNTLSSRTITAGNGLTGGGNLTANRTLAVGAGAGISVTADAVALATSGVTAGNYGPSANASPAHSGTFSVPYITVDTYGRVTGASTKTITLPSIDDINSSLNTLDTAIDKEVEDRAAAITALETAYKAADAALKSGYEAADNAINTTITDLKGGSTKTIAGLSDEIASAVNNHNAINIQLTGAVTGTGTISSNKITVATSNKALKVGSKTYNGTADVNITAADLGLSAAIIFLGTTTSAISDGSTTNPITIGGSSVTATSGNVVLYSGKEFIWTGSLWELFGDEGSYALKTISITAGNGLTGGGDLSTSRTLAVGAGTGISVSADTVSLAASGVTEGTYGAASTPAHGGTFAIPSITFDTYGRATKATTVNVTLPAAPTLSGGSAAAADATVVGGVTVSGHAVTVGKKTLTAGSNVTITGAADKITIAATDTNTTNVIAGNGLTGGGSAASGTGVTLNVGAGTGITVAADTVSLATSGVTAGSYGPTANVSGSNGATISVPQITVDAYGRVTSVVNRTYTSVNTDTNTDTKVTTAADTTTAKAYVTTCTGATTGTLKYHTSVYVNHSTGVLMGAAWNDYAEYRETRTEVEPGRVVCENGDDTLSVSTARLQPGANIVSDTFGFAIGETEQSKTPLAVSGRVLAYPYEDRHSYKPGDAVCAGPDGTVSKMSREEIMTYPECILGTVSAIPEYETWGEGNVPVNGRIWIKVK